MANGELATQERNTLPAVARERLSQAVEAALATGDLSRLNTDDRIAWYNRRCAIARLDPSTRPFEYITLQNKLTLYATKSCTDQLNGIHGISHESISRETVDGIHIVTVQARTKGGRTTTDIGAIPIQGLRGPELANALMKTVTKAKRRATLSLCGLGDVIDESELDTVSDVRECDETGRVIPPANDSGFGRGQYASPDQTKAYLEAMVGYANRRNTEWLDWCHSEFGPDVPVKNLFVETATKDNPAHTNKWQLDNHLVNWAIETGRLDPSCKGEHGVKNNQIGRYTAIVYHRSKADRGALAKELERYLDDKAARATEGMKRALEPPAPESDEDTEDAIYDAMTAREPGMEG